MTPAAWAVNDRYRMLISLGRRDLGAEAIRATLATAREPNGSVHGGAASDAHRATAAWQAAGATDRRGVRSPGDGIEDRASGDLPSGRGAVAHGGR